MARDGEGGLLKGLFQREDRPLQLTGYQATDVTEEKAVRLVAGAALAGHIRAPVVTVEGLLFGTAVARQVVVRSGGRIWGDVYAVSISVQPGGYVNGWVRSLLDSEYDTLFASEGTAEHAPYPGVAPPVSDQVPAELGQIGSPDRNNVDLLRLFQAELQSAHLAREELEQHFDERVAEVAGNTQRRVVELEEAVTSLQLELATVRQERTELDGELIQWEERFETQGHELAGVRSLLQQRVEALKQAQQSLAARQRHVEQLEAESDQLQEQLRGALEPLERLQDRVQNLESTLQASVQRNAEQEEAQLRWQELAEVSRARGVELEKELAKAQQKFEAAQQLGDELKERLAQLEGEIEVQAAARDAEPPEDGWARRIRLEAQLEAAQAELAALEERLTWQRLTTDAATARLAANTEKEAAVQAKLQQQLDDAAARVNEYRELAENWKANVGRLTELLYEAEQETKRQASELEQLRSQVAAGRAERRKLQQAATRHILELQAELEEKERERAQLAGRRDGGRRS